MERVRIVSRTGSGEVTMDRWSCCKTALLLYVVVEISYDRDGERKAYKSHIGVWSMLGSYDIDLAVKKSARWSSNLQN